jgi:hypothetical protein
MIKPLRLRLCVVRYLIGMKWLATPCPPLPLISGMMGDILGYARARRQAAATTMAAHCDRRHEGLRRVSGRVLQTPDGTCVSRRSARRFSPRCGCGVVDDMREIAPSLAAVALGGGLHSASRRFSWHPHFYRQFFQAVPILRIARSRGSSQTCCGRDAWQVSRQNVFILLRPPTLCVRRSPELKSNACVGAAARH